MIFSLIIVFASFLISLIGTKLLIVSFRGTQMMVDKRGGVAIPRAGGLALSLALLIPMMVEDTNFALMLGVFLLVSVSLLADLIVLPSWVGLLVQAMAASILLGLLPAETMGWDIKIILIFLWLFCMYGFAETDRMEGMTAATMMSMGLGFAFIATFNGTFPDVFSVYSLIIASAGAGFLWWSWPPAKIILGKVGAVPFGFIMGYVLLMGWNEGYMTAVLILPAYYASEAALMLGKIATTRRLKNHMFAFERAQHKGWKPASVIKLVAGINILLGFLGVYSLIEPDLAVICVALAYMSVFMLLGFFNHQTIKGDKEFHI